METLHILRSEPDSTTRELFEFVAEPGSRTIRLYTDDVDWNELVDTIFQVDKVISWW